MTARRWLQVTVLLAPGLGIILWLIGSVVYVAIAQSFGAYGMTGETTFTLSYWADMFMRNIYFRSIRYSLYVGILSAIFSVALAYPLAIWLRKPFPGSMAIGAILKAPLLVHGLVAAFLFINFIAYNGVLNQLMQYIGFWDGPRRLQNDSNAFGILLLQTWKNMPFALLLLTGAVQSIPDDILDAARDMGAGPWDRFRRVIAPLTVSGMQAALIIIFIGAVADFSFQTIAGPTNRQSMSQLMVGYKSRGDWQYAGVVGVTLMVMALVGSAVLAFISRIAMKGRLK